MPPKWFGFSPKWREAGQGEVTSKTDVVSVAMTSDRGPAREVDIKSAQPGRDGAGGAVTNLLAIDAHDRLAQG